MPMSRTRGSKSGVVQFDIEASMVMDAELKVQASSLAMGIQGARRQGRCKTLLHPLERKQTKNTDARGEL